MGQEAKFLVDDMLGRLARWLRILGYDAAYSAGLEDRELARRARAEGRVLLTRDMRLARRRGLQALLVESELLEEQLRQVIKEFGLCADESHTRCSLCNVPLEAIPKAEVESRVPPYVWQTQEHFMLCPECGRLYWRGTHWQRMREKIAEL